MPYTPPLYNAVDFNFTGTYTPPLYSAVNFDFGSTPLPPTGATLPTAARLAITEKDDWFFMGPKRFTPPVATPSVVPLKMKRLTDWGAYEETWRAPSRRSFYTPAVTPAGGVRPVLYVIT